MTSPLPGTESFKIGNLGYRYSKLSSSLFASLLIHEEVSRPSHPRKATVLAMWGQVETLTTEAWASLLLGFGYCPGLAAASSHYNCPIGNTQSLNSSLLSFKAGCTSHRLLGCLSRGDRTKNAVSPVLETPSPPWDDWSTSCNTQEGEGQWRSPDVDLEKQTPRCWGHSLRWNETASLKNV